MPLMIDHKTITELHRRQAEQSVQQKYLKKSRTLKPENNFLGQPRDKNRNMHSNIWLFSSLASIHTTHIPLMDCIYVTPTQNKPVWFELLVCQLDKGFCWVFDRSDNLSWRNTCIYFRKTLRIHWFGLFLNLVLLLTLKCIISNTLKMCVCEMRFVTAR